MPEKSAAHEQKQRVFKLPEELPPEIARWIWVVTDTRERTLASLRGLKQEQLDREPAGANSIASLLYHIAVIEMSYLYEDILGLGWCEELASIVNHGVRTDDGRLVRVQGEDLDRHMQRLHDSRRLLLESLLEMSAEDLTRSRVRSDYTISAEWALHHLVQHEAQHRGQIELTRLIWKEDL